MKIGIITFQLAWNCGAVLQCYALQEYLKQQGHEVQIINYRPEYKKYRYKKYCNPFVIASKQINKKKSFQSNVVSASKSFIRTILNYNKKSEHIRQWQGFKIFCDKYLNLTEEYISLEQLKRNPPECDVYISGSDQLWNPVLTNNILDPAYFLDFGTNRTKKITYAVSACELDMDKYGKDLTKYLSKINYISLRESHGQQQFQQFLKQDIEICPDPTFLPECSIYNHIQLENKLKIKDYILVYALGDGTNNEKNLFEKVEYAQRKFNKEVLVICGPRNWPFSVTQIRGITPEEFLYYIQNASYVISNSFHATVFSILYHKQFVTLSFKNRNARMEELLGRLQLQNQMVNTTEEVSDKLSEVINYIEVDKKKDAFRTIGKNYLEKALR